MTICYQELGPGFTGATSIAFITTSLASKSQVPLLTSYLTDVSATRASLSYVIFRLGTKVATALMDYTPEEENKYVTFSAGLLATTAFCWIGSIPIITGLAFAAIGSAIKTIIDRHLNYKSRFTAKVIGVSGAYGATAGLLVNGILRTVHYITGYIQPISFSSAALMGMTGVIATHIISKQLTSSSYH